MNALIKLILVSLIFIAISSCSNYEYLTCGPGPRYYDINININEISYSVLSDSISIRGEILDSLTFEFLIGGNIQILSKDLNEISGVTTDINGNFVLGFKYVPSYLIKFSYVGYRSQSYNLKTFIQKYFDY
ncbi:MAG: carboxypeptidase-like regulatory domain-containing protein [Ignavibacteria bacterium]|nr:carboxypeptidase-like regulatory domain-containing protein [Ignavibacteria bacterium]